METTWGNERGGNFWKVFLVFYIKPPFSVPKPLIMREIAFHRQIYSCLMENWNFGKLANLLYGRICFENTKHFSEKGYSLLCMQARHAPAPMSCLHTQALPWNKLLLKMQIFSLQSTLNLGKFINSNYIFFNLLTPLYSCQSHLVCP